MKKKKHHVKRKGMLIENEVKAKNAMGCVCYFADKGAGSKAMMIMYQQRDSVIIPP